MEDVMSKKNWNNEIGDYKMSAQIADHDGWFICDGRELSRKEYAELFAIIGTSFGAGNGKTTFNLPDFKDDTTWKTRNARDDGYMGEGMPQVAGYVKGDDFIPADPKFETVRAPNPFYSREDRLKRVSVFILAKKKNENEYF